MALTRSTKAVVGLAVAGGIATAAAGVSLVTKDGVGPVGPLAFLTVAVAASWLCPLVIQRGAESEAIHPDEGFFVALALILPAGGVVLAYAVATLVAQAVRGRAGVKSAFNSGQMLTAVGLGVAASHAISTPGDHLTPMAALGAVAGAMVFFVVNSAFFAAILAATGASTPRLTLVDGIRVRSLIVAISVVAGLGTGLAVSAHPLALLALALLPFAAFRQIAVRVISRQPALR